ncbi:hypothetical protein APS56_16365 [Pseudalgibacter alginicilyticus]|uniref:Uncharacterized protein n=1 Tax=Pseudalgibacter alginicilyticus TaxID=1736674 RepID=A0A0P0CK62_9FLAO|nr:hypothetical protein [Pseudalgibacter alginicilyticus]ALJ06612.1 hypothetical protein APS56_16365 [Pseudalgibacter alginicilyticus]
MILRAFKENSNKKYLNNLLSKRKVDVMDGKIESLGIILNVDELADFDLFRAIASDLKVHPNNLKVIAFSSNEKDEFNSWDLCFNPKDFGWRGYIKNVELQAFLNTKFDALISYYTHENLELKLLTASSKAKFKIGNLQTDTRLNDLIIKTDIKEFEVFSGELLKYLMILNKIKNEQ